MLRQLLGYNHRPVGRVRGLRQKNRCLPSKLGLFVAVAKRNHSAAGPIVSPDIQAGLADGLRSSGPACASWFQGFGVQPLVRSLRVNGRLPASSVTARAAYSQAFGASLAGQRAVVAMSGEGLGAAADVYAASLATGVRGGLVIVAIDDPVLRGSSSRVDSRGVALQRSGSLLIEPCCGEEAHYVGANAARWSEELDVPIIVRLCTRGSRKGDSDSEPEMPPALPPRTSEPSFIDGVACLYGEGDEVEEPTRRQRSTSAPSLHNSKSESKFFLAPQHCLLHAAALNRRRDAVDRFVEAYYEVANDCRWRPQGFNQLTHDKDDQSLCARDRMTLLVCGDVDFADSSDSASDWATAKWQICYTVSTLPAPIARLSRVLATEEEFSPSVAVMEQGEPRLLPRVAQAMAHYPYRRETGRQADFSTAYAPHGWRNFEVARWDPVEYAACAFGLLQGHNGGCPLPLPLPVAVAGAGSGAGNAATSDHDGRVGAAAPAAGVRRLELGLAAALGDDSSSGSGQSQDSSASGDAVAACLSRLLSAVPIASAPNGSTPAETRRCHGGAVADSSALRLVAIGVASQQPSGAQPTVPVRVVVDCLDEHVGQPELSVTSAAAGSGIADSTRAEFAHWQAAARLSLGSGLHIAAGLVEAALAAQARARCDTGRDADADAGSDCAVTPAPGSLDSKQPPAPTLPVLALLDEAALAAAGGASTLVDIAARLRRGLRKGSDGPGTGTDSVSRMTVVVVVPLQSGSETECEPRAMAQVDREPDMDTDELLPASELADLTRALLADRASDQCSPFASALAAAGIPLTALPLADAERRLGLGHFNCCHVAAGHGHNNKPAPPLQVVLIGVPV